VTIGVKELANASPDAEEGALIGEYDSDRALEGAVDERPLKDHVLAAITQVRDGPAPPPETPSSQGAGAGTESTSDQTPAPLWVTIGLEDPEEANPAPDAGGFIGEYESDDALRRAVDKHSLRDHILAAIDEVRGGAASSTETTSPHEGGAEDAS
jgi:hypothetical protein